MAAKIASHQLSACSGSSLAALATLTTCRKLGPQVPGRFNKSSQAHHLLSLPVCIFGPVRHLVVEPVPVLRSRRCREQGQARSIPSGGSRCCKIGVAFLPVLLASKGRVGPVTASHVEWSRLSSTPHQRRTARYPGRAAHFQRPGEPLGGPTFMDVARKL